MVVADWVPATTPPREPVKFVEVDALPDRKAVITPAEKLPEESLATMADAVFVFVAVVAAFATRPVVFRVASMVFVMLPFAMVVADWVPATTPPREPVKFVEVDAFPNSDADITLAEKLPEESLAIIVEAVFAFVAVVAAFATRPAVLSVASMAFVMLPFAIVVDVCVPPTTPEREPVKLADVVAFPDSDALMTFAEKFPEESLVTMADGVLVETCGCHCIYYCAVWYCGCTLCLGHCATE